VPVLVGAGGCPRGGRAVEVGCSSNRVSRELRGGGRNCLCQTSRPCQGDITRFRCCRSQSVGESSRRRRTERWKRCGFCGSGFSFSFALSAFLAVVFVAVAAFQSFPLAVIVFGALDNLFLDRLLFSPLLPCASLDPRTKRRWASLFAHHPATPSLSLSSSSKASLASLFTACSFVCCVYHPGYHCYPGRALLLDACIPSFLARVCAQHRGILQVPDFPSVLTLCLCLAFTPSFVCCVVCM
jgi:hypothetical protein